MIMFTGTNVWSLGAKKGASSFYQTIRHYAENSYQIDLITCNRTDGLDIPGVSERHLDLEWLIRMGSIPKMGFVFRFLVWLVFQVYVVFVGFYLARNNRPAVLYAYEITGVPAVLLLGRLMGLPVVSRFQGTVMKPLMTTWGWRVRYFDHWLGLRAHANLVIMANDGTQGDEVLRTLGIPENTVRFWMNGVDVRPKQYSPQKQAVLRQSIVCHKDTLILLTVSRLVAWKRLDRIITAMPEITRHVPEARLVIVGDGEARAGYERLVRELDMGDYVVFTGAALHAEVAKYFAIADIFISLYDLSNVGNPLLEAMAWGKCVVTLNNGGTSSIVSHSDNGVLIEPDAIDKLPETVVELLRDNARRVQLGCAAQEYALQYFWTWHQRMAREISEVKRLCSDWKYRDTLKL